MLKFTIILAVNSSSSGEQKLLFHQNNAVKLFLNWRNINITPIKKFPQIYFNFQFNDIGENMSSSLMNLLYIFL